MASIAATPGPSRRVLVDIREHEGEVVLVQDVFPVLMPPSKVAAELTCRVLGGAHRSSNVLQRAHVTVVHQRLAELDVLAEVANTVVRQVAHSGTASCRDLLGLFEVVCRPCQLIVLNERQVPLASAEMPRPGSLVGLKHQFRRPVDLGLRQRTHAQCPEVVPLCGGHDDRVPHERLQQPVHRLLVERLTERELGGHNPRVLPGDTLKFYSELVELPHTLSADLVTFGAKRLDATRKRDHERDLKVATEQPQLFS